MPPPTYTPVGTAAASNDRAVLDARLVQHLAAALVRAIRAEDEKIDASTRASATSTTDSEPVPLRATSRPAA
jgi:hypothetical protein